MHCYRLTGSFDEAEDLVQETLLRAWRGREQLEDDAGLRARLYKIATNVCGDLAREVGPGGVRIVGIWTAGLTDSLTTEKLGAVLGAPVSQEMLEGIIANLDSMRMTGKSPVTAQIAATAAFLASDDAAAVTGTWINATAGMFPS